MVQDNLQLMLIHNYQTTDEKATKDKDLEVRHGLHIAIIPENVKDKYPKDGLVDKPNDSAKGGIQVYEFDPPRKVNSFVFVDADRKSIIGTATAFDADGNVVKSVDIPKGGDGSIQTIVMDASDTSRLEIEYRDSGGVTNFDLKCPTTITLRESLSLDDFVDTPSIKIQKLKESLAVADDIDTISSKIKQLAEKLTMQVDVTASQLQELKENLTINDTFDKNIKRIRNLSETLSVADDAKTIASKTKSLNESLTVDDKVLPSRFQMLSESLVILDEVDQTAS